MRRPPVDFEAFGDISNLNLVSEIEVLCRNRGLKMRKYVSVESYPVEKIKFLDFCHFKIEGPLFA